MGPPLVDLYGAVGGSCAATSPGDLRTDEYFQPENVGLSKMQRIKIGSTTTPRLGPTVGVVCVAVKAPESTSKAWVPLLWASLSYRDACVLTWKKQSSEWIGHLIGQLLFSLRKCIHVSWLLRVKCLYWNPPSIETLQLYDMHLQVFFSSPMHVDWLHLTSITITSCSLSHCLMI